MVASSPGRPHPPVSNARTEGFNRIIKQTKRVGCCYRSMENYQRRILSHIAVTDRKGQQHERDQPPPKYEEPATRPLAWRPALRRTGSPDDAR
jgi:hypothetical protein